MDGLIAIEKRGKDAMAKNMKRIHKVVVKRMVDDSPDTSWLGEYANSPTSEFSIDRKHALDCQAQPFNQPTAEGQRILDNANDYLQEVEGVEDEAYEILESLRDGDCTCDEGGDMERNEYRYFNPSFNYVDKHGKLVDGNTPDEVRKYVRQDYERMEDLNRGGWYFVGVAAEAQIQLTYFGPFQDISSGGLWGIESDSGDYFKEVEAEQLSELRQQLHALGFSQRAISAAFKTVRTADV